jgi:transposase
MPTTEVFDVELLEPITTSRQDQLTSLPTRVQPSPQEALSSWLLRYAAPLGVPPERLLLDRADMDLIDGPDWWRRPCARLISRLAERSGLDPSIFPDMTFSDWSHIESTEDLPERFASGRFQLARPEKRALNRVAICPGCLAEDEIPYIRKHWTVGWTAVCRRHGRVLVHECPECHYKLRMPRLSSDKLFTPERCKGCGFHLSHAPRHEAHPDAMRLQELLIAHRTQPVLDLPGIGALPWPTAMAFFDVLLGMCWNGPKIRFREQLFARIGRDLGLSKEIEGSHYAGVLTLGWMLDTWPQHIRVAFATLKVPRPRRQLERWNKLAPAIKREIEKIFIPAWPDETHDEDRGWWRGWIDTLPLSGETLREMAMKDRFLCRRIRLLALADVRDGMPVEQAAKVAGVTAKTLYRWIRRGAEGGLQAALERPTGKLSQLQTLEIANWIATAPVDKRQWRFDRVQSEVRKRFGVEIAEHVASRLLYVHGPWRHRRYERGCRPALVQLPIED